MNIATDIGAYVGAAAFVGLVFVVPLYFSQARDIKRLRTWMLLTPDLAVAEQEAAEAARVAEEEAEAAAEPEAPPVPPPGRHQPTAPPAPAAPPVAPSTAPPAPPSAPPPSEPRPVPGLGPSSGTTPSRPLTPAERIALDRPATQRLTAERAAVTPPSEPGRLGRLARRQSTRGLVAFVVGVLVLAVAVVFVVLQTGGDEGGGGRGERPSAVVPSEVEVAVLNGTAVPDLAARVGDDVEANDFVLGAVTNSEVPFDKTVVMYEPGSEDEGQAVAKDLGVARVEPMDDDTRALADGATVAVVAGEDRAQ